MKIEYLSGMSALNRECELNTHGEWSLNIDKDVFYNSSQSVFGDWGIEENVILSGLRVLNCANHLRAILDFFEHNREFNYLRSNIKKILGTDEYNKEMFEMVLRLKAYPYYKEIDLVMIDVFGFEWVIYDKTRPGYDFLKNMLDIEVDDEIAREGL